MLSISENPNTIVTVAFFVGCGAGFILNSIIRALLWADRKCRGVHDGE